MPPKVAPMVVPPPTPVSMPAYGSTGIPAQALNPAPSPIAALSAPSSTSKKRTAAGNVKYYAVKCGHTPGVFTNYADVLKAVTGFKGAIFKSFTDQNEAEAFRAGRDITSTSSSKKKAPEKFYGLAAAHHPGVYTSWDEAQRQIEGFKGPKYKRFATRAEAEEFVRNGGKTAATPGQEPAEASESALTTKLKQAKPAKGGKATAAEKQEGESGGAPSRPKKRTKMAQVEVADGQAEEDLEIYDGTSYNGRGMLPPREEMLIYTDGSSLGNGRDGAVAGVGVFFGEGDERNISEPLTGPIQTNQRAELTAISRALSMIPPTQSATIVTDSRYSIDCVTIWFANWERNGWMSSMRQPVSNQDIIKELLGMIRMRETSGARTNFTWIKGHAGDANNVAADRLAVEGARRAQEERARGGGRGY